MKFSIIAKGMVLFAAFSILACKDGPNESQILADRVMAVHDEIMPKMSNINSAKKELELALKAGADSTIVFGLLGQLDDADEAMMVWMDEYLVPEDDANDAVKKEYLSSELVKIQKVKTDVLESIEKVSQFTSQFKLKNEVGTDSI